MATLPPLVRLIRMFSCTCVGIRDYLYRYSVLILTFMFYTSYHLSRKPISIVKGELHRNCSNIPWYNIYYGSHSGIQMMHVDPIYIDSNNTNNETWCDWAPFDQMNYQTLFGALDYAFLFTYAIAMFVSGYVGERMPLRYFLGFGMILCGVFTSMFGLGKFFNIHSLWFYILAQVLNGFFQTTGWPGVVAAVGKWFGKGRRGFIMGVWNSHTSVGNILGSVIASAYVQTNWGWSFIVPGIIIGSMGVLCLFTLVEQPEDVGCPPPVNQIKNSDEDDDVRSQAAYQPIPTSEKDEDERIINGFKDSSVMRRSSTENLINDANLNPEVKIDKNKAISIKAAILIPGVIEFSLCLLFAKLVSYTFLFWLPYYIKHSSTLSVEESALMSTLFDVGGIVGGITAGLLSDLTRGPATTCGGMLLIGAAMMYLYNVYGGVSRTISIVLLLVTGAFVNGPYSLITTAVSADLGSHAVLGGNSKALATVTAIIDGTGSIGAAIGPLLTGLISNASSWNNVFWMLIGSNIAAFLLLLRLIKKEVTSWSCYRTNCRDGNGDY